MGVGVLVVYGVVVYRSRDEPPLIRVGPGRASGVKRIGLSSDVETAAERTVRTVQNTTLNAANPTLIPGCPQNPEHDTTTNTTDTNTRTNTPPHVLPFHPQVYTRFSREDPGRRVSRCRSDPMVSGC